MSSIIKVYSKSYCPYCTATKELLHSLKVNFEEIDVTDNPELLSEISKKSGLMTVPQIFVGEKCLGGSSDIHKLHEEGKLLPLLKENA